MKNTVKDLMKIKETSMKQAETLPGGGFHGGEQTETLPGGGFHGGEQTETLPGGGFHGGEQTETLPGGGFHGGEQTETLPGGGFHGGEQTENLPGGCYKDVNLICVETDVEYEQNKKENIYEEPPWKNGIYGEGWNFS